MTFPAGFSTADRMIRFAMENAGLLEDGEDPTEEQQAKYLQRLQDILNFLQTQGLKLFLLQDTEVPLVVGQALYSFGPTGTSLMAKPLRVLQAYYLQTTNYTQTATGNGTTSLAVTSTVAGTQNYQVDDPVTFTSVTTTGLVTNQIYYILSIVANTSVQIATTPGGTAVTVVAGTAVMSYAGAGIRRPLIPLSWDEWMRLSQLNNQGAINSYFVDKQTTLLKVHFWNTPDTTAATQGNVHLLLETQATQLVTIQDTMMFPIEWYLALQWLLAAEISTGQPQSVIQRCEGKAQYYKDALENWDVEDTSTRFEPDSRSQYYNHSLGRG